MDIPLVVREASGAIMIFWRRRANTLVWRQSRGTMDEDDLPPQPEQSDSGFAGALGQTFSGFVFIALFLLAAGAIVYAAIRWL
jgi:hypothetical protein